MRSAKHREPAFDALRVFLLFLGFVVHSLLSYIDISYNEQWPYKDAHTFLLFDGIVAFIHNFRMPSFFLISGYFVEQMFQKLSPLVVLKKRIVRLIFPFILAMLICFPLINFGFYLCDARIWSLSFDAFYPRVDLYGGRIFTSYLWFLYYLIIFNCTHFLILNKLKRNLLDKIPLILILIVAAFLLMVVLLLQGENDLNGTYSFIPNPLAMSGFFMFYFMGILFRRKKHYLEQLAEHGISLSLLAFVFFSLYLLVYFIKKDSFDLNMDGDILIIILYSLSAISLTFSSIALFIRFYKKEKPWVSYLSSSSYFLYLIHLPIIIFLVGFLSTFNYSAIIKAILVLVSSILISLLINHFKIKYFNR